MAELPHLFPDNTGRTERYTTTKTARDTFKLAVRNRDSHGAALLQQLQTAESDARSRAVTLPANSSPAGVVLAFESDPGFALRLKSLEDRQSKIELLSVSVDSNNVMRAAVFVPDGKMGVLFSKFQDYADPTKDTDSGRPRNQMLAESISHIGLAILNTLWTDSRPFPDDRRATYWWEIWLRVLSGVEDVTAVFGSHAKRAGVMVSDRKLRFPDRHVVLAHGTIDQLMAIDNLFDLLTELRSASIANSEFLSLSPQDQGEFVMDSLQRIQPPPLDAPAVCHLDTGVNRGHPLLSFALNESHFLAADPNWSPADRNPQQHGTGMAGLALYGCLSEFLNETSPIELNHRLESVKILSDQNPTAPDLYGEITAQSVSRIEIAAPERTARAFALTVTADGHSEGSPTSWSAAIDQIASGAEDEGRPARLILTAAGNTPRSGREVYPDHNYRHGIEEPGQAWNALTVGAYTERTTIRSLEYRDWRPVAGAGLLSPSSRTSRSWSDLQWAIKPDIVMEGGNSAIDPATQTVDDIDDLQLLSTRLSAAGALLTSTGDTSSATALAARYAAMIWARYPLLRPETVRALLVHSSRWTDPMLAAFPQNRDRHKRLRTYGYGVPHLKTAMSSAANRATMIIEDSLQPFQKLSGKVKTKDFRLHRLPWANEVLQQLGGEVIRMRITLSYFIEPSPGQRGWTLRHRYQSHGLRFDVKRPLDESDEAFLQRITISTSNEDDDSPESPGGSERDDREWQIGSKLRSKGSIHSDVWTGTTVELASAGVIAVFPVTGWWKERPHLSRWDRTARYSLIVTLETDRTDVDLYTPIKNQIDLQIETTINTD